MKMKKEKKLAKKTKPKEIKKEFDFQSLYEMYPRKEGKKSGMDNLNKRIKTDEEYIKFRSAVFNYIRICQVENRPPLYTKHWGTFVNNWTDYLEVVPQAVESKNITQMQRVLSGDL